jgi:hypothetical protein
MPHIGNRKCFQFVTTKFDQQNLGFNIDCAVLFLQFQNSEYVFLFLDPNIVTYKVPSDLFYGEIF